MSPIIVLRSIILNIVGKAFENLEYIITSAQEQDTELKRLLSSEKTKKHAEELERDNGILTARWLIANLKQDYDKIDLYLNKIINYPGAYKEAVEAFSLCVIMLSDNLDVHVKEIKRILCELMERRAKVEIELSKSQGIHTALWLNRAPAILFPKDNLGDKAYKEALSRGFDTEKAEEERIGVLLDQSREDEYNRYTETQEEEYVNDCIIRLDRGIKAIKGYHLSMISISNAVYEIAHNSNLTEIITNETNTNVANSMEKSNSFLKIESDDDIPF